MKKTKIAIDALSGTYLGLHASYANPIKFKGFLKQFKGNFSASRPLSITPNFTHFSFF